MEKQQLQSCSDDLSQTLLQSSCVPVTLDTDFFSHLKHQVEHSLQVNDDQVVTPLIRRSVHATQNINNSASQRSTMIPFQNGYHTDHPRRQSKSKLMTRTQQIDNTESHQRNSLTNHSNIITGVSPSSPSQQSSIMTIKSNLKHKLAAPKPVRASLRPLGGVSSIDPIIPPPVLVNANKWSQASPIKTDPCDQKRGERRESSFEISEASRRIDFQNDQNLIFIIKEDEIKNRSNSPIKELQELLEAEQEFYSIFNKPRYVAKDPLQRNFAKGLAPIFSNLSPDARTSADQSFSTLSSSTYSNIKQAFSQFNGGVASLERPCVQFPLTEDASQIYNNSLFTFTAGNTTISEAINPRESNSCFRFSKVEGKDFIEDKTHFIHSIKRVSCNPFKNQMSPLPEQQKSKCIPPQTQQSADPKYTNPCNLQAGRYEGSTSQEDFISVVDEQQKPNFSNIGVQQNIETMFCNLNLNSTQQEQLEFEQNQYAQKQYYQALMMNNNPYLSQSWDEMQSQSYYDPHMFNGRQSVPVNNESLQGYYPTTSIYHQYPFYSYKQQEEEIGTIMLTSSIEQPQGSFTSENNGFYCAENIYFGYNLANDETVTSKE